MLRSIVRTIAFSSAALIVVPFAVAASDMQTLFNTEAWQLQYEIIFKASSQGVYKPNAGSCAYTTSLERHFTKSLPLNMRTGGPSISQVKMLKPGTSGGMSLAESQKYAMELLAKTEHTATWMNAGIEFSDDATDEEQQAAGLAYMKSMMGLCTLECTIVDVCKDLVTEMGTQYDQTTKTHYSGSAKVRNSDQIMMEMDASSKKYILTLGHSYMDDSSSSVQVTVDTHSESKGGSPFDTTTISYTSLEVLTRDLRVDDSTALVGMNLYLEGNIEPATGKIVGEHNLRAHYPGYQGDVSGILTIRFTLTPK